MREKGGNNIFADTLCVSLWAKLLVTSRDIISYHLINFSMLCLLVMYLDLLAHCWAYSTLYDTKIMLKFPFSSPMTARTVASSYGNKHLLSLWYVPGIVLKALYVVTNLIFPTDLWSNYCYYLCFNWRNGTREVNLLKSFHFFQN